MRNTKEQKNKLPDDSPISLNNGKSVRYRLRKQQEREAEEELKEFEDEHNSVSSKRVY